MQSVDGVLAVDLNQLYRTGALPVQPNFVLEANNDLAIDLRASTFHPPTLEMLEGSGVTRFLIDNGLVK